MSTYIESRPPSPIGLFSLNGKPFACRRGPPLCPLCAASGVNSDKGLGLVDAVGLEPAPSLKGDPRCGNTSFTSKKDPRGRERRSAHQTETSDKLT